jgi:hypothetical protein
MTPMQRAAFFAASIKGRVSDPTNPHQLDAYDAAERLALRAGYPGGTLSDWGPTPMAHLLALLDHEATHPHGIAEGELFRNLSEVWVRQVDAHDLILATGKDRDWWVDI